MSSERAVQGVGGSQNQLWIHDEPEQAQATYELGMCQKGLKWHHLGTNLRTIGL